MLHKREAGELQFFFEQITSLSELFRKGEQWDEIKSKHGKIVAKFTKCLIKQRFVKNTENRIGEVLFQLQIALLKG